jgi:SAM-dependent methyltransferase
LVTRSSGFGGVGSVSALSVSVEVDVAMKPEAAFAAFTDELSLALYRLDLQFDPAPRSLVSEKGVEVGRVASWRPGKRALILWHPAGWTPDIETKVELKFRATKRGTRVSVEHRGLRRLLDEDEGELLGWFADQGAATLLSSSAPSRFGDWLTDRWARRPTGSTARKSYRNPTHHRPGFRAILDALKPSKEDYLLEVGCGGGAFLKDALKSGCRAAAIDHSPEMVRLARKVNAGAVKEGRLDVREAQADLLPFGESSFACAVRTNVLFFLSDAVAFAEIRRVLVPGGRMAVFTTSKEAKGTPAAPEPRASRMRFYEDAELETDGPQGGFQGSTGRTPRPLKAPPGDGNSDERPSAVFHPGGPVAAREEGLTKGLSPRSVSQSRREEPHTQ